MKLNDRDSETLTLLEGAETKCIDVRLDMVPVRKVPAVTTEGETLVCSQNLAPSPIRLLFAPAYIRGSSVSASVMQSGRAEPPVQMLRSSQRQL